MAYRNLISDAYYKSKFTGAEIDRRLTDVDSKQDIITDLDEIREGAAKGETAYQLPEYGIPMSDLSQAVQDAIAKAETVEQAVEAIQALIPAQASESNQLADKDFVNSSIATNTANFIGTFNSVQELEDYSGTLTNNDYAFVIGTDAQDNTQYDRYKYVAESEQWLYEYTLNNSSFTAAQWAAINSGMTASLVTKVNDLPTKAELDTALDGKVDKVTGKGLSTNDYTDAEKAVVEGLTGDTETFELKERRTRGGVFSAGTGMAASQQITGKTEVWNQLVKNGNFVNTSNWKTAGAPNMSAANNTLQVTKAATGSNITVSIYQEVSLSQGHIYYFSGITKTTGSTKVREGCVENSTQYLSDESFAAENWTRFDTIFTAAEAFSTIRLFGNNITDNTQDVEYFWQNVMLVDLTVLFNGNVPTGYTADTFNSEHPLPYYGYNAGSLLSVNPTGIFSRGFNLWDEVWEPGAINSVTGANQDGTFLDSFFRSKGFIPVSPNTRYYFKLPSGSGIRVFEYDINKKYLTYSSSNSPTTSPETRYVRFRYSEIGNVYQYNIAVSYYDTKTNGLYEPYAGSTLPIDLTTATAKLDGQGASVIPFANGVNAIGDVKDIIRNGDALKRIDSRAYQAGDESDTTVVTDMTTTIFVMATPEHYIWDNPLGLFYPYDNLGTEQALPEDTSSTPQLPVPMTVKYEPNGASFMRFLNEQVSR